LKPLEHLRELALELLEFDDLLLHGAQLLGHEDLQSGTHGCTLLAIKLSRQHFDMGEGKP
jgi:hypothetical protein